MSYRALADSLPFLAELGHDYCVRLVASALIATGDISATLSKLLHHVKGNRSDATIKGWKKDIKAVSHRSPCH